MARISGINYQADRDTKEIARLIRKEIRKALPGLKLSITSNVWSINIYGCTTETVKQIREIANSFNYSDDDGADTQRAFYLITNLVEAA